jgi:hypothetical protein
MFYNMPNLYNIYQIDERSNFSSETTWHQHGIKGPFIIYTLWGWEILMSYTNILKPPPLDDLNVEDPPIKYWKIYTPPPPPHLY